MASIQDVLLAKIAQDNAEREQGINLAGTAGALGGAALGVAAGSVPHAITRLIRPKAVGQGLGIIKPGARMAGGLVGAMIGGGLGAGIQAQARQHPAADLLAKIQTSGDLSSQDQIALQNILADSYSSGPGLA